MIHRALMTRAAVVALLVGGLVGASSAAPSHGRGPATKATAPAPRPASTLEPGRRTVAILEVRADGVPPEVRTELERGLEQQLDTNSYWVASRQQVRERMRFSTKWAEGCLVGQCLAEVRVQTGAELVLLAALNGSGTSFGYVITLVRTDTGRVLAQESNRCDVCTVKEATTEATLASIRLLNAVPDELPDEAADQGAAIDLAVGKLVRRLHAERARLHSRAIKLTLSGLAIAAAGAALYIVKDKPDYALVVTAAGGGLMAGGVVVLTF